MKIKFVLFALTILIYSNLIVAQSETTPVNQQKTNVEDSFKPSGNPLGKVFFNFHSDFENENINSAFELKRAYFGYSYNLAENFSTKVLFDVGEADVDVDINDSTTIKTSTSLKYTAFVKNAQLTYKHDFVTVNVGLIGNPQFSAAEKLWGHRYIAKNVQDEHKFAPSADFGISANLKIIDMLSVDLTVRNGEGYKKLESDDIFITGLGFHFMPVKGLTFRGYYDYSAGDVAQYTVMHFLGYKNKIFSLGGEHIYQSNYKYKKDNNHSAVSAYASIEVIDKLELFGRFDTYNMEVDDDNDSNSIIGGVQYAPVKKVLVALNFQSKMFKDDENNAYAAFLNFQYAF